MSKPKTVRAGSNPHDLPMIGKSILPPYLYIDDLINMACDMVRIENLQPEIPKTYIPQALIETGGVGFLDSNTYAGGFYWARPLGLPIRYNEWDRFEFFDRFGRTNFEVTRDAGARFIKANAKATPPRLILERLAIMLDLCDRSIAANIRAQIMGRVFPWDNKKGDKALDVLMGEFESGLPLGLPPEQVLSLQTADLTVPVTFDRTLAGRAAIWADAMQRVGSVAAMQYSRERTQSAEVNAYIASTIDLVYIMINTFNDDCERQNILGTDGKPLRMVYAGYAKNGHGSY